MRTSPSSDLWARSGDDDFITTGQPMRAAARTASAAEVTIASSGVEMPYSREDRLRPVLGQRTVEQAPRRTRLLRRASWGTSQHRAPRGQEPVPVVPSAHGAHAVAERAEHGDPGRAEQDVAVGGLGADRGTPDHADRLVRGLGDVDEILRQAVAHRWEGAGDRADQQPDVGVGDEGVEQLAAALVADGMPAVVDRVRHPEERRDRFVELGLRGRGQRRHGHAGDPEQVGHVGAGPAADRVDDRALARSARPGCGRGTERSRASRRGRRRG